MAEEVVVDGIVVEVIADTTQLKQQLEEVKRLTTNTAASISTAMDRITQRSAGGLFGKGAIQEIGPATSGMKSFANATAHAAAETLGLRVGLDQVRTAGDRMATALDQRMEEVSRETQKHFTFMTSNIFAQVQDVGVQIAAGTEPLQIALQQGTQLAQVFKMAGDEGASFGKQMGLVGTSLLSLISPATLLPVLFIGAGAAAVKFFRESEEGAKTAEDRLKEFQDTLKGIAETFGVVTEGLDDFVKKSRPLTRIKLLADIQRQGEVARDVMLDLQRALGRRSFGFAIDPRFRSFSTIVRELDKDIQRGSVAWEEYRKRVEAAINQNEGTRAALAGVGRELLDMIEAASDAAAQFDALKRAQKLIDQDQFGDMTKDAKAFADVLGEIAEISPIEEDEVQRFQRLAKALRSGSEGMAELAINMGELNAAMQRTADKEQLAFELDNLDEAQNDIFELIKLKERFRSTPYSDPSRDDPNDLAIGFGFHKVWDEMQQKYVDVLANMKMSQERAVQELARQWRDDYGKTVLEVLGPETWNNLTSGMKAAIGDIVFNYGRIPPAVAEAAKSLDPERLAAEIRKLQTDNGGINRQRRLDEAAIALGTTTVDMLQDRIKAEKDLKKAQDEYVLSAENRLRVEELESKLTFETVYERTRQVEVLKRVLAFQEKYGNTNEAVLKTINAEAEAVARDAQLTADLSIAKRENAEATKQQAAAARQLERAFQRVSDELEGAFVDAIFNGERLQDVIKSLIRSLAEMALRAQLSRLFGALFAPISGALAPMVGGTLAGGGASVAGAATTGMTAAVAVPTAGSMISGRSAAARQAIDVNVNVTPSPLLVTSWDTKAKAAEERAIARAPAVARNNNKRFGVP